MLGCEGSQSIALPLMSQRQILGLMVVHGRWPLEQHVEELMLLARQVSGALAYAQLSTAMGASREQLKRRKSETRRAQEFIEGFIASMPTAMVVVKSDLEVVFANRALRRVAGLKKQKIEGKRLPEVLPLDGVESLVSAVLRSQNSVKEQEVIYRHPRTGRRWFRVSASRLLDQERQPIGDEDTRVILSLDDVTEWRYAQERVQETSRLTTLGEIVAGVAHELNNPLTSVMGFAQLLMEQQPEGENRMELEIIFAEAQRATKVVRNLLTFVRKRKAEKSWVDLASTVEQVLTLKSYDLRACNIEVETAFAPDLPNVYVDEHQLEQVFLNIVTNAEQAMAEAHRGGHLLIQGRRDVGVIRLSFEDNGPGIPARSLKTIFAPFFTTKGARQGTGLGLSICRSLVQEQGGRIWAESEAEKGATFHVEIPLREN